LHENVQNKKKPVVVLIADVIHSRSQRELRSLLGQRLSAASRVHMARHWIRLPYAVTAGDEFQTIGTDPAKISQILLDLRSRLWPLQLRIGIGIGEGPARIQAPVNRLGGAAFVFARKALESIKKNNGYKFEVLTSFRSRNTAFDSTVNLIYGLHDTLLMRITEKQWETIKAIRAKGRLEPAARKLHVDVSTVWRNLKRGHFWQLDQTATSLETLIRENLF
jgi:hypothetical protein